jgi:hypothetical protein
MSSIDASPLLMLEIIEVDHTKFKAWKRKPNEAKAITPRHITSDSWKLAASNASGELNTTSKSVYSLFNSIFNSTFDSL